MHPRDNKMRSKILVVGPYPPPYSGPELGTKLLLESEVSHVFHVRFLNTSVRKNNADKGKVGPLLFIAFFSFLARLLWAMIVFRPQVAYHLVTTTQVGWCGRDLWFLLVCRICRTKVVVHLRAGHLQHNMRRFHPAVRFLMRRFCASISMALVQAECLRGQFEGLVSPDRIRVLPNAVEADSYSAVRSGFQPIVLFLGHASKAKGYCDLVRSIPIVVAAIPDVQYVVAGAMVTTERCVFMEQTTGCPIKHEDPFDVHKWISSSIYATNYRYLGMVTRDTTRRLLQEAAVFALPSYSEGFSRALLEAMAAGKPVICTPVGAHGEVIKEAVHGFLVSPGDEHALARRIVQLLTDSALRERMSETNARYAREQFSAERIANLFIEYVQELCEGIPSSVEG